MYHDLGRKDVECCMAISAHGLTFYVYQQVDFEQKYFCVDSRSDMEGYVNRPGVESERKYLRLLRGYNGIWFASIREIQITLTSKHTITKLET